MPISDLVLYTGTTTSQTGGAVDATASTGSTLNSHQIISTSEALVLQKSVDCSVTRPKPSASAPNGYTQGRREIFVRMPILLANGKYTTNTLKITLSTDIETSDAQSQVLRDYGTRLLFNSEMNSFYNDLSVA